MRRDAALRIGDTDAAGRVVLETPIGATRFSDGRIVVGDKDQAQVMVFDSAGAVIRRVGGEGAGPGEFRQIWWVGQCDADVAYVWDLVARRMSLLGESEGVEREYAFPADRDPSPHVIGCSRDGIFAYQTVPKNVTPLRDGSGLFRGSATVRILDEEGARIADVEGIATDEMVALGGGSAPRPAGKRTHIVLTRDRLYVGTGDSAMVRVFDLGGEERDPIELPGIDRRAPEPRHMAAGAEAIAVLVPGPMYEQVRGQLLQLPIPERLPPYSNLLADPDGLLWVVTSVPGDETTELMALDAEGTLRGRVSVADPIEVFEVGRDYILGRGRAQLDLPYLALYRLNRGS